MRDVEGSDSPLLCAPDDCRGQRVLAHLLETRHQPEEVLGGEPLLRSHGGEYRFAFRQRPGLVHDDDVHLLHHLESLGFPEQDPYLRAPARTHHDGHRRRQTEGTRAGDDEHGDRVHERMRVARLGAGQRPSDEGDDGHQDDDWDEPAGDRVGEALNRRARSLGIADEAHNPCEQRGAAHTLRFHHEGAGAVHGAAGDRAAGGLLHRDRLPGHHGFVHRRGAVQENSVDRHAFTGTHAEPVPHLHLVERNILLSAFRIDPTRGRGRQAEQLPDRRARTASCAELEHLSEQHQDDDDGSGLEVDANLPAVRPEGFRKQPRHQGCHDAEPIRGAHAKGDEREHVQVAVDDRRPAAHEEGPATPHDNGCREHELRPCHPRGRQGMLQGLTRQELRYHEREDRGGEHHRQAEPSGHVVQLGVRLVERDDPRLESHAALGAGPGRITDDFRVHRTGPLDPSGRRGGHRLERHAALRARARACLTDSGSIGQVCSRASGAVWTGASGPC